LHRYRTTDGIQGCLALGRQALLLDSVLRYRSLGSSESPIFG
jgi:hypothetical protein